MSREYIFYPAFREEETGKYVPLLYDVENNPADVFWRSGSFIDEEYFSENFLMVKQEELGQGFDGFIGDTIFKGRDGETLTYLYKIPLETLENIGASGGEVSGYAPIDSVMSYYQADEDKMDYFNWQLKYDLIPAEVYAELPQEKKEKYIKFSAIDYYGKEYICAHLAEIIHDLYVPYEWKGELCILMHYSF